MKPALTHILSGLLWLSCFQLIVGSIASAFNNPFQQYGSWPQAKRFAIMNRILVQEIDIRPDITNMLPNCVIVEMPDPASVIGELRTLNAHGWLRPPLLIPGVRYGLNPTNGEFYIQ